ncbi:hypothetical protein QWY75_09855 [Pontixanthobacter aestiaquae]|uniref:Uncharacterized protein n=1 Tax=Pontixanthobacter aestiaquae TaxID=1509367 RepID=A0A844Z5A3_9SPHN|nr:hypothetical protein [Pontixanthobacter aestiaquae]MDN3646500.1 hypothetical protein [Pontixanthobacter aestiaquae]MXO82512.1 hypothetical protein [Pontixanthobacter aestiaquae]
MDMHTGIDLKLALVAAVLGIASAPHAIADEPIASEDGSATGQSERTLQRLRANSGITLQWIGWDYRGQMMLREQGDTVHLSGGQIDQSGGGTLWLDGEVVSSGDEHFIFEGLIRIANTPDDGRICQDTKRWRFAITQNRKYYRLREFEWCDGLTDYIDIYL